MTPLRSQRALEARDREAQQAVRFLALHVLSFTDSTRVLHEVTALAETRTVSMEDRVVLYEKWRHELWLAALNQGGESLESLKRQLAMHKIAVPERLE